MGPVTEKQQSCCCQFTVCLHGFLLLQEIADDEGLAAAAAGAPLPGTSKASQGASGRSEATSATETSSNSESSTASNNELGVMCAAAAPEQGQAASGRGMQPATAGVVRQPDTFAQPSNQHYWQRMRQQKMQERGREQQEDGCSGDGGAIAAGAAPVTSQLRRAAMARSGQVRMPEGVVAVAWREENLNGGAHFLDAEPDVFLPW